MERASVLERRRVSLQLTRQRPGTSQPISSRNFLMCLGMAVIGSSAASYSRTT